MTIRSAAAPPGIAAAALSAFSPAAQSWFLDRYGPPTAAQEQAWQSIQDGDHTLVVAPTGSGKTLAAFYWALDRLHRDPAPLSPARRCRVLYISPLKALAVDVDRNLREPLAGLAEWAPRHSGPTDPPGPQITVGVRTGDTPQAERRRLITRPPDVLITTPESLFLLLTSQARRTLTEVHTVIIDEVHALAGNKRGAHLAVSLERLDALLEQPAQRIGLSATVRPIDHVARWLADPVGGRPTRIVAPEASKRWDLRVEVPVPDLTDLQRPDGGTGPPSIWPAIENQVATLIDEHHSTLVFANSRRQAEKLTARLNEVCHERTAVPDGAQPLPAVGDIQAAQIMGAAGASRGAAPVIARAHHGSVSKERRALVEEELKAGLLPAVVATSSLELGIDMGAVDLVVQVECPPSVASGLQRVGRAGHQVGAVSKAVIIPTTRGDLVNCAVVVDRMKAGQIEALRPPLLPLDVLSQQVVAMVAVEDWPVESLLNTLRRAQPFARLNRDVLARVLDMLSGYHHGADLREIRPVLIWDRARDMLSARPGAARLAVTSGGTIPDRGLYGVFLAEAESGARRVGELDEEMVYESRVGYVITLGSTTWQIEQITHDQVLVSPAPGRTARLPFWKGESVGRPAELGRAIGAFSRRMDGLDSPQAREILVRIGLTEFSIDNLLAYQGAQRQAVGALPTDRRIVIERFRDELGDWHAVIHSPFGGQVHAPWALVLNAVLRQRLGHDLHLSATDDGIILRLPEAGRYPGTGDPSERSFGQGLPPLADCLAIDPEAIALAVAEELTGSVMFAARFRECAARDLLLPRRDPKRRQALWQQRLRAGQLLETVSGYTDFPIVAEAARECIHEVFDLDALREVLSEIRDGRIEIVEVDTSAPSPFAHRLLFGYVAQFLYDDDVPLAERRTAALSLDGGLLGDLLGGLDPDLREVLDPAVADAVEAELQRLALTRRARTDEHVVDLLRVVGPLSVPELVERCIEDLDVTSAVQRLAAAARVISVIIAGERRWAIVEDAARLRDGLGTILPPGIDPDLLGRSIDPLGELVSRYAATHGPFEGAMAAAALGLGLSPLEQVLAELVKRQRLLRGRFTGPPGDGASQYCDPDVLKALRGRSLAAAKAQARPVPARVLARFLPQWQGVQSIGGQPIGGQSIGGRSESFGSPDPGMLLEAIEQLSGVPQPIAIWDRWVLPARVPAYAPEQLDALMAQGLVGWAADPRHSGGELWVHLVPTASGQDPWPQQGVTGPLGITDSRSGAAEVAAAVLDLLGGGGAYFLPALASALAASLGRPVLEAEAEIALWSLVEAGLVSNDSPAVLRRPRDRRTAGDRGSTPRAYPTGSGPVPVGLNSRAAVRAARTRVRRGLIRTMVPTAGGRWFLIPRPAGATDHIALERTLTLIDRYGLVTRGLVHAEGLPGGFAATYRVLSHLEDTGRLHRVYAVEGVGGSQFATAGAVDALRRSADEARTGAQPQVAVLAATDPANAYGSAIDWPDAPSLCGGHLPGRRAGAAVVLVDGELVFYIERGGSALIAFADQPELLRAAAEALATYRPGGQPVLSTLRRVNGITALDRTSAVTRALEQAGFAATPQGLRLR